MGLASSLRRNIYRSAALVRDVIAQDVRGGRGLACPLLAWPGDPAAGERMLGGVFGTGTERRRCPRDLPWLLDGASSAWYEEMHGFDWLGHLLAIGDERATACAAALVGNWSSHRNSWTGEACHPHVIARRLVSLLAFGRQLGLEDSPRFADMLTWQARELALARGKTPPGTPALTVSAALLLASLCLPRLTRDRHRYWHIMEQECRIQIDDHDGSMVGRRPDEHVRFMQDLLILRNAAEIAIAAGIIRGNRDYSWSDVLRRTGQAVRFLRHGDGGMAVFNGGGECEPSLVDQVLQLAPPSRSSMDQRVLLHAGFGRLARGETTVIADLGATSCGLTGHAGIAGFEMSLGACRFVVNRGFFQGDPILETDTRSIASHSTLSVGNGSPMTLNGRGRVLLRPKVSCWVPELREDETGIMVGHEGWLQEFGVRHSRTFRLSGDGLGFRGEDLVTGGTGHTVRIRFHLHPGVHPEQVGRDAIFLRHCDMPDAGLLFRSQDGEMDIDDGYYCGDGQFRSSPMIRISGMTGEGEARFRWMFRTVSLRRKAAGTGSGPVAQRTGRPAEGSRMRVPVAPGR